MQQFLQQLINGLSWGAILALIAVGYTMVYGVLRLINFAHGDIYMVGAMGVGMSPHTGITSITPHGLHFFSSFSPASWPVRRLGF